MLTFTMETLPGRVSFGPGKLREVEEEVRGLGARRALVLATPPQKGLAEQVAGLLGDLCAGVYDKAEMHVPAEVAGDAARIALSCGADCLVAPGGGSTIGLAKAITLKTELPILAIPTTYAGSKMTPIWGITEDGLKRTGRDRRVLPRTVIYDPKLLVSLPASITGPSGMNSVAHAVEALYAPDANPVTSIMAEEAIRAFAKSLVRAVEAPSDLEARSETLYGAWLSGVVLGSLSMGLHHKLCHTLGGSFNLPHAETHAILLPHVAAFNAEAAPEALGRVATALGATCYRDAGRALYELLTSCCTKTSLSQIGMKEVDVDTAAEIATHNAYSNPRKFNRNDIGELLNRAFHGCTPTG